MSACDPLRSAWEALARAGCDPHGQTHDFRAKCPVHNGDGQSLHAFVGADGRAVLHCFAHRCEPARICIALGLSPFDLYPAGHQHGPRLNLPPARRADFAGPFRTVADVLAALQRLDTEVYVEVRTDCPNCGSPAALLRARRDERGNEFAHLSCPGDPTAEALGYGACTLRQFERALAGRVHDLEGRRR